MVSHFKIILISLCIFILTAEIRLPITENHPPEVSIKTPKAGETIIAGRQMFYEIEVNDREDGATAYQEIEPGEVFLEVAYFKKNARAVSYADQASETPGLSLIKSSMCFNCHAANSNLGGPPFIKISGKYNGQDIKALLMASIKNGSKGKWGNTAIMPANPHLSDTQISLMADWIIDQKNQPETYHLTGTSGMFSIVAEKKDWFLVLKASYKDHGSGEPGSELVGIRSQWHAVE